MNRLEDGWLPVYPLLIFIGDLRNDLYLTLTRGDFEKGVKTAAKNIEVRVVMCDTEGHVIEVSGPDFLIGSFRRD